MFEKRENYKGAIFMMASMAGYVLNDTMIKLASGEMEMFQLVFLRGLLATVLIAILAYHQNAFQFHATRRDVTLIALRTFAELGATFCFLSALFKMPLANVTAIMQSLPLAVALAASVFLGEKVGWRRYVAILIGFAGVMIIIRPVGGSFNVYSLWALGAVAFVTLRELTTRTLGPQIPSLFVALITSAVIMAVAGVLATTQDWQTPSVASSVYISMSAVFILVGYIAGVVAMRHGEIGFVSPFRFSSLLWAIALGLIVFSETIDLWMATGSILVVGTGAFTFYRERQAQRNA